MQSVKLWKDCLSQESTQDALHTSANFNQAQSAYYQKPNFSTDTALLATHLLSI